VAAARDARPDGCVRNPLKASGEGSSRHDVLVEAKPAAGFHYPPHFRQRLGLIANGAQDEGCHHRIL
jgi:hypothetical protein